MVTEAFKILALENSRPVYNYMVSLQLQLPQPQHYYHYSIVVYNYKV